MFSTPENVLIRISGALGMKESHFLQQKSVLRKCCGVSQKQWMLELSNLCHCVQHSWKLTSREFWSSRKLKEATFWAKMCFKKMLWGISETVNGRAFQTFAIVFSKPENLSVGINGALGTDRKTLSKQKCVLRICCGVSQKQWMLELSNLCHCVQHPWQPD